MKVIIVAFLMVLISLQSSACIIDPSAWIAEKPEMYLGRSSYVVKGKIIEFLDLTEDVQIVSFQVLRTFKGAEQNTVIINNYMDSSCSRAFLGKGRTYYIFAKQKSSEYVIHSGSFIDEASADNNNLGSILDKAVEVDVAQ